MPKEPTARDVMSEGVIAIEADSTVQEAASKMKEEDIRSLVVVEDDEAVGIIVGRDIVYNVVSEDAVPSEVLVEDVMTSNLVTAAEDDNIEDIARAMVENDISRVPVLRGDSLVGIVTQSNLVKAWPSYVDLLQEETHAFTSEGGPEHPEEMETQSGNCDSCGNYSEELVEVSGELLCPECREEGLF